MDDKNTKEHFRKKVILGQEQNDKPKVFIDYLDEFISLKDRKGTIIVYETYKKQDIQDLTTKQHLKA